MSRRTTILLVIVVVGVAIRIAYALTTGDTIYKVTRVEGQMAHNIVADGRWFVRNETADNYLEALTVSQHRLIDPASVDYASLDGHGVWYPEVAQSVGESVVIAGIWAVTGDERYVEVQVFQGVVDGLAALLVYWIAMQLFMRVRPALIAAGLYALYPPLAWQTVNPYNDIWAVDFTIALVAIYLVVLKSSHRWRWLIVGGLCAGVGAYFRPQVLLIVPVLAVVTVARTGWREALRRAVTATLVAGVLLVPWTIRNYNDFHTFVATRSGFWETMWAGLDELPGRFGANFDQVPLEPEIHHVRPESPAGDAYFKPYVIDAIERHPLSYLEVLAYRVGLATVLAHDDMWMRRGDKAVFASRGGLLAFVSDHPFATLEYLLQPLVFVLGVLGLLATWRRYRKQNTILLAVALCVLVPYLAIHVEARYLLPAVLAYFIWIGLGTDLLIERLQRRRAAVR